MILSGDRVESAVQELVRLRRRRRARRGEALCTHRRPVLPGSAHASDLRRATAQRHCRACDGRPCKEGTDLTRMPDEPAAQDGEGVRGWQ